MREISTRVPPYAENTLGSTTHESIACMTAGENKETAKRTRRYYLCTAVVRKCCENVHLWSLENEMPAIIDNEDEVCVSIA